jgi:hypothetical protein
VERAVLQDPPPPDDTLNRKRLQELRAAVGRPLGWTPGRARLHDRRQHEGEFVVCDKGWYFTGDAQAVAVSWAATRGARPVGRIRARVELTWDGGRLVIWFPTREGAADALEAVNLRTAG